MNPLLNEAQQRLREAAQDAVQEHVAPRADAIDSGTDELRGVLRDLGGAGVLVPEGEPSERLLLAAIAVEQVARKSGAVAVVAAVHAAATVTLASEAAAGDPPEGTDAGESVTVLAAVENLKVENGSRVSGTIDLVPGAAVADRFLIAIRGGDAPGLYLLAADRADVGEAEELMGLRGAATATVGLEAVEAERVGDAAAAVAAGGRLQTLLAAVGVGIGRGCLDVAIAEIHGRKREGERPDRSQAVQWKLADIATQSEAARAATWNAACQADADGLDEASAMARLLAAEAAVDSARRAVQIFGGRGAVRGAGVERLYRDAKLMELLGGANEEHLARIARHVLPDLVEA